jgi:hypothetical protein
MTTLMGTIDRTNEKGPYIAAMMMMLIMMMLMINFLLIG